MRRSGYDQNVAGKALDKAAQAIDAALGHTCLDREQTALKLGKPAAPLMKYAERIFSRPAFIEALTPSEKVMRK